jgi:glycosyltransferase involved in cell wall biosynthesis
MSRVDRADPAQALKIVQVAAPTAAGGLERVVETLAVGLHLRGHDVTVAALLLGEVRRSHPFVDMLTANGVRVYPISIPARAYLRERREIAQLCRTVRPHVVHTHGYRIDLLDRRIVAAFGIPTVTTVHGASKTGGLKGAFFERLQRRNYRRFDAVVAVSKSLRDATLADGVTPDRVHLIPNAWTALRTPLTRDAARMELGLDPQTHVVGWVGRFIPVKGGDLFLDALSRLPPPRPVAAIIGYGSEAQRLQRRAQELDLGACVRFYGEIRDASRYFAAFDTYVLSSRSEGLPIVLLEAMATETPIVATRVGGVTDVLGEKEGWLVPPEDASALAQAIHESLELREEAARRARSAALRLTQEYSLDGFLDRYEDVYRAVVSHPRR